MTDGGSASGRGRLAAGSGRRGSNLGSTAVSSGDHRVGPGADVSAVAVDGLREVQAVEEIKAIVEPYLDDSRVRHVPTGSEISAPENATRATGAGDAPFIGLLNDHDKWDPEFLGRRVEFSSKSNQSCGIVFSHSISSVLSGALFFQPERAS